MQFMLEMRNFNSSDIYLVAILSTLMIYIILSVNLKIKDVFTKQSIVTGTNTSGFFCA